MNNTLRFTVLCFLLFQIHLEAQNPSALYQNWVDAQVNSTEPILPTFSYAGYHNGEVGLPASFSQPEFDVTDAAYGAIANDGISDKAAIKLAIAAAEENPGGGIVKFPPGKFIVNDASVDNLNESIIISKSNIVIKGSGSGVGGTELVEKYDLSSLKVLGSVGEPINEEAWHWYNDNVGKKNSPIVDTWWQTETGGIMISPIPFVTPTKPTYATLPFIGIQPALMDENGDELKGNQVDGRLCIKFPWPSMARTIWRNHERYKDTYFSAYKNKYFTGDGALRDEVGYYRITGRVDDVIIVSGHNLGTAPIEDAINEHPAVAESAIVGFPHDVKGSALYGYVTLKDTGESRDQNNLRKEINQIITEHIGPIAKLDKIQFTSGLPKTRSGKIMRRILRKIASKDISNLGDTSTLLNPEVVQDIIDNSL
ncbi:AMP-binding protein [Algibacter sp. 2305UL17-15]|uniref:AMP-binding enzyme n=1 Tax=Algibacter sp. 2305UL17-15 TaxID=3231268 RepID=UPI00345AD508